MKYYLSDVSTKTLLIGICVIFILSWQGCKVFCNILPSLCSKDNECVEVSDRLQQVLSQKEQLLREIDGKNSKAETRDYPFERDSCGAGLVHPDQMVVEIDPKASAADLEALRKDLNMIKRDSCECDNLELWVRDGSVQKHVPIQDNITAANSAPEIKNADYNRYVFGYVASFPQTIRDAEWGMDSMRNIIRIGVLDTGVDIQHQGIGPYLLKPQNDICNYNIKVQRNYANNNDIVDDDQGHGTHVAGIIIQNLNAKNIINYKIIPYKTHDSNGMSTIFDITCATYQAIRDSIEVINASWGYLGRSPIYEDALDAVHEEGITFVTSSGNDTSLVSDIQTYPIAYDNNSKYDNIIGVGSCNSTSPVTLSLYSNFDRNHVDIVAEGKDINSFWPDNSWNCLSGTSMAAPAVTAKVVELLNTSTPGTNIRGALLDQPNHFLSHPNLMNKVDSERFLTHYGYAEMDDCQEPSVSPSIK